MLSEIHVEGYRAFATYELSPLAQVNLLVGKNNAGKSSLLEAIHLVASPFAAVTLSNIAVQRGEVAFADDDSTRGSRREHYPDLSHFFHGHDIELGVLFNIRATNASLSAYIVTDTELTKQKQLFGDYSGFGLVLNSVFRGKRATVGLPISSNGGFDVFEARRAYQIERTGSEAFVQSLSPSSLDPDAMRSMWDQVIAEGEEQKVIDALQIIDPEINSIVFLSADRSYRLNRTGVVLGFSSKKRRLPLGSQGDGIRRLLGLALALARTQNGTLLVDEIDTGLHWSVMADMWRLVIETAQANATQVFATTHSLDCVRGLDEACRLYPHLANLVAVHTIDRDLDHSIHTSAEDLRISIDQQIEVRG